MSLLCRCRCYADGATAWSPWSAGRTEARQQDASPCYTTFIDTTLHLAEDGEQQDQLRFTIAQVSAKNQPIAVVGSATVRLQRLYQARWGRMTIKLTTPRHTHLASDLNDDEAACPPTLVVAARPTAKHAQSEWIRFACSPSPRQSLVSDKTTHNTAELPL